MENGDAEATLGNRRTQHKRKERMDMIHLTGASFPSYRHIKKWVGNYGLFEPNEYFVGACRYGGICWFFTWPIRMVLSWHAIILSPRYVENTTFLSSFSVGGLHVWNILSVAVPEKMVVFSLKFQRNNQQHALTVDSADGKAGEKGCVFAAL